MPLVVIFAAIWLPPAMAQRTSEPPGLEEYTVVLDSPAVGERLRSSRPKSEDAPLRRVDAAATGLLRREVARSQEPVRSSLEVAGVQVVGSVRNVLNAILVRATPDQVETIRSIPGVRRVAPSQRHEPLLPGVAEIVNIAEAGVDVPGRRHSGDGLKIAIIDSGIDSGHPAFHDTSLEPLPGYPIAAPEHLQYTNNKIVAVRTYVGGPGSPSPDDTSPRDYLGHGTHVAMIAAGRRVRTPLGEVQGIAPRARLGVYKVFGTPGLNSSAGTSVLLLAVDDAVADGMDILNLSLGRLPAYPWDAAGQVCGQFQPTSPCDPLLFALESAVHDFGRVVVAAAGNDGAAGAHQYPATTSLSSFGTPPSVIAVGNVSNTRLLQESVQVGAATFESRSGTGPGADGPLTAPAVHAAAFGNPLGCGHYPDGALRGRVLVVDRGECFFQVKVEHADAAGAAGVLVVNRQGEDNLISMALLEDTDIPAFFVGASEGAAVRELLVEDGTLLTLDPTPVAVEDGQVRLALSSSRGPTLTLHPKPDLVAPGGSVYTAAPRRNLQGLLSDPSGFRETAGGTSMAAPVVAGAAALVWAAAPSLTPREVASRLINTASETVLLHEEPARVGAVGAGLLDIQAAMRSQVAVVPHSVAFGSLQDAALPVRRTLRVANRGLQHESFRVDIDERDVDPNASLTVDGRRSLAFELAPGGTREINIALDGSRPAPGSYEGNLRLTSMAGRGNLHVPYLYVVGDGIPYNALIFRDGSGSGPVGASQIRWIQARIVDQFGVPVAHQPVRFRIEGGGRILDWSPETSAHGQFWAKVNYTGAPGLQVVVATVGDLETTFTYQATESQDVPQVLAIGNAANPASPRGVPPGSLAVISGIRFSEYEGEPLAGVGPRPLPISRKGVTVEFETLDSGLQAVGRIYHVLPNWVVVQVPWELDGAEEAFVKVNSAGSSEPFPFQVAATNPGIYSRAAVPEGPPIAVALHGDLAPVTEGRPARRGLPVTLLMTGNGPVADPPPTGHASPGRSATQTLPRVLIGGARAQVTFSGLTEDLAGLYAVTAVVPRRVAPGNRPVVVEFGKVASNSVLLPVR